jgi:hypothetical protein
MSDKGKEVVVEVPPAKKSRKRYTPSQVGLMKNLLRTTMGTSLMQHINCQVINFNKTSRREGELLERA